MEVMMNGHGLEKGPVTAQMFGNAGREHMEKYGNYIMLYTCSRLPKSFLFQKYLEVYHGFYRLIQNCMF